MPTGIATANKVLTRVAVASPTQGFIAPLLAPEISSSEEQFDVTLIDTNALSDKYMGLVRGPSAESAAFDVAVGRPTHMKCVDHAVHTFLSAEALSDPVMAVAAQSTYVNQLVKLLLIERERDFVALCAGILTSTRTSTPGTKWDASGATPIADIKVKIALVEAASGVDRSMLTFACPSDVLAAIMDSAEAQTLRGTVTLKEGGISSNAIDLAKLLGIKNVVVGAASYNSAAIGATPSFARCWSDNALLCYVDPAPGILTAGAFATAVWNQPDIVMGRGGRIDGWAVFSREDQDRKAQRIEASRYYDMRCLYGDDASADSATVARVPAHYFTNTLT